MSAKLNRALEFANYRATLNNQQQVLKTKLQAALSHSVNGGTFNIDRTLISFVKALINEGHQDAVLLDIYENPIRVELEDFYEEVLSRYFEATNDYYAKYEKLRKARKVSSVLDIKE